MTPEPYHSFENDDQDLNALLDQAISDLRNVVLPEVPAIKVVKIQRSQRSHSNERPGAVGLAGIVIAITAWMLLSPVPNDRRKLPPGLVSRSVIREIAFTPEKSPVSSLNQMQREVHELVERIQRTEIHHRTQELLDELHRIAAHSR